VKATIVNRAVPTAFSLNANYPNPFNPTTNISFGLPVDSKVSLKIYNVAGQLVRTLVNETMVAGTHTVTWDGANSNGEKVASGIYFYKLNAGDFSKTMKMVMTK
jgi:flagellar hook assembly protein FlgD